MAIVLIGVERGVDAGTIEVQEEGEGGREPGSPIEAATILKVEPLVPVAPELS